MEKQFLINYLFVEPIKESWRDVITDIVGDIEQANDYEEWKELLYNDDNWSCIYQHEIKEYLLKFLEKLDFVLMESERVDSIPFYPYQMLVTGNDEEREEYDPMEIFYLVDYMPQKYKKRLGIVNGIDPYVYFINNSDLPDKLKKDLQNWNIAKKV